MEKKPQVSKDQKRFFVKKNKAIEAICELMQYHNFFKIKSHNKKTAGFFSFKKSTCCLEIGTLEETLAEEILAGKWINVSCMRHWTLLQ